MHETTACESTWPHDSSAATPIDIHRLYVPIRPPVPLKLRMNAGMLASVARTQSSRPSCTIRMYAPRSPDSRSNAVSGANRPQWRYGARVCGSWSMYCFARSRAILREGLASAMRADGAMGARAPADAAASASKMAMATCAGCNRRLHLRREPPAQRRQRQLTSKSPTALALPSTRACDVGPSACSAAGVHSIIGSARRNVRQFGRRIILERPAVAISAQFFRLARAPSSPTLFTASATAGPRRSPRRSCRRRRRSRASAPGSRR